MTVFPGMEISSHNDETVLVVGIPLLVSVTDGISICLKYSAILLHVSRCDSLLIYMIHAWLEY